MAEDSATARYGESWQRYRTLLEACADIRLRREPEERWQSWRGHCVHVDVHSPDDVPRGYVILVHGGGGHGRLLAPLGDALAALGWCAWAPDLPGYGVTRVAAHWDWDYGAWPALVAHLAQQAAGRGPVVLAGFSVGGLTALRAAQLAPSVRGVAVTTLIDLADDATFVAAARWRWLGRFSLWLATRAPGLLDRLPIPLAVATPLETLTTFAALKRYFLADPLLGRKVVPGRFFRSLHDYRPPREDYELPCPLLLVHPGADTWTPTRMSLPVYQAIDTPKSFVELTGGAHLPLETPAYPQLVGELKSFLDSVST